MLARGIPDGPDDDFETLRLTLLGAIACARVAVHVVTPYFLPDASLITVLIISALRCIEVNIVLPEENDLILVQWASTGLLRQILERGCRVWLSPPPFDHTKLMLVNELWTLLGSANWDPRSLRLNFEFNVECYDRTLATSLTHLVQSKIQNSRELKLEDVWGAQPDNQTSRWRGAFLTLSLKRDGDFNKLILSRNMPIANLDACDGIRITFQCQSYEPHEME